VPAAQVERFALERPRVVKRLRRKALESPQWVPEAAVSLPL
jgi:hypothetical protein